ncbi:BZ3500_MvSof-1268-A1-R1_Chr10-2g03003 [Microbotryum saponariae]|uniref:BZ3500_MvSof-1268-A1-R1_Chr10-2g03003 protein n=1 Tax=Microbotryum saponariae TaxID=289078 RepID=A0A2X0KQY7_9BASI|nr:BZ3501_MvSof-1269-A2-R1_Chr10-2g02589 [Microbotryum saponariae]SDA01912.1 BZ3500_MvSof-1268-A1-R1_Chr10-2g03003 [Microbotryum saponariae]
MRSGSGLILQVLNAGLHNPQHFFRPYAKAVVALPRLCKFHQAAQDAVEKLVRVERLLDCELEGTPKIHGRMAKDTLTQEFT